MDELKAMFRYAIGFAVVACLIGGAYAYVMVRAAEALTHTMH